MAAYFFNITEEERNNILDKHKHLYDGYVTNYGTNKEQPLYVQDLANDKNGITVNNRGEVKKYTNMGINESMELPLDMIGDGEDDLEYGTMGDEDGEDLCTHCNGLGYDEFTDEQCEWCGGSYDLYEDDESFEDEGDEDPKFEIDVKFLDDVEDEDSVGDIKDNVNESLDWFRRVNKYN
jgi:hypothetical protein